jgi:hypothetical protein
MIHYILIAWFVASLIVALFGSKYRFGFWGYFFGSLLLSPIVGFLLLMAAIPPRQKQPERAGPGA